TARERRRRQTCDRGRDPDHRAQEEGAARRDLLIGSASPGPGTPDRPPARDGLKCAAAGITEECMLRGIVRSALAAAALAAAMVASPSAGKAQDAASLRFGAEGFVLANGMQVVVIPNHRVPAVT